LESRLGKFSLARFDKIICVKDGDLQNMPVGLKEKTVEIPAFIPPAISGASDMVPLSLKFNESNSFKMLLSGFIILNEKFYDLYGFGDAIRLLEQLRMNGKNAELVLIVLSHDKGKESADYVKHLKNECLIKGLDKYVCWIEGVSMELWPMLKKVHVLLRPTKSDGDALSIRESLFLKVPVITSNVVPRPSDSIVYDVNSENDLLNKTIPLIENYQDYVSKIGNHNISFAKQIIEQYENQ
jgi:glycosyltransferase involved in cell wall biosynthesis